MTILNGQQIVDSDFIGSVAYINLESSTSTTHSVTTNGSQKLWVVAKGWSDGMTSTRTISLQYDGVTKDTVNVEGSDDIAFCLEYVETPSAGTRNITIVTTGGNINVPKIVVLKTLSTI